VDKDEAEAYRKRGVTNLHVKQPVFTLGLLALDLLNLSAPGLVQSPIFSAILFFPILNIVVMQKQERERELAGLASFSQH
jgi:hypothetical protein